MQKSFSSRLLHRIVIAALALLAPALATAADLIVKVTTDRTTYLQGQAVNVTAQVTTANGARVTNPKRRDVSIITPSGSTVTRKVMSNKGNGLYTYRYTLSGSAPLGTWRASAVFETSNAGGTGSVTFGVAKTTADTTPPVTSATPGSGTFSAPVSVTLSANEPAIIYYTTDGTTPTTASAVYSAPIPISTTVILKYFARDTAGNNEAVNSAAYAITVTPPSSGNPHASLTWSGAGTCLPCHGQEAGEVHGSVHYQWKGATPAITNHNAGGGKAAGAMNAYCINITGNWNGCGACHVGLGAQPTDTADQAQLRNIDCLICHQEKYRRVKSNGVYVPDTAAMTITMDQAVQTVQKPTRNACLQCHAKAGGGDAVKRGDLALAHGATTDRAFDVHMATTGADLACQACHQTTDHQIPGRGSDLRPTEGAVGMSCSTTVCHPSKTTVTGHATSAVNTHVSRVACQTCHIGTYARNASDTAATEATETFRDWQQPHLGSNGVYHPLMQTSNDLRPAYAFWNGTSWAYDLLDTAAVDPVTGAYPVSRPLGGINDAKSKLYPFKYKTASQPLAILTSQLIPVDTSVYFATGNLYNAVQSGLINIGLSAGTPYSMVTTDEYQVLNHEVNTRDKALACADCHGSTSRIDLKKLGYVLKATASTVCVQCHGYKSNPGFTSVHSKHVTEKRYDCSFCHSFSRPERGLRTTR